MSRGVADEHWAYWLAQMIKVSIVAYLVGGAFQNLAYWDVPYYLFVAIAVTRWILKSSRATESEAKATGAPAQPSSEPSPLPTSAG